MVKSIEKGAKMIINSRFFELLILNDQKKIHDHIITNGKTKSICPIRFFSNEEKEKIINGNSQGKDE